MITKFSQYIKEGYTLTDNDIKELKLGLKNHYTEDDRIQLDIEYLKEILKQDTIKLYRVLFLPDIKYLNKDDLGEHWSMDYDTITYYIETLRDGGIESFWMNYSGDEEFEKEDFKNYLIKAETNISNIDINKTIQHFINFPYEVEAEILDKDKVNIISIKEYNEKVL